MGRPLANTNFGSAVGKIAIRFHNGTSVVTGYIYSQIGTSTYVVTTDGTTFYTVTLAQDSATAASLTSGLATIVMTDSSAATHYVAKLMSVTFVSTADEQLNWSFATATTGTCQVAMVQPAPTASITVGAIADQTHAVAFTVTGTFTGNAPTALRVKIGTGAYAAATSPVIGSGTYSVSVTVPSATSGETISVQDYSGSVAGVSGVSAAFNVA